MTPPRSAAGRFAQRVAGTNPLYHGYHAAHLEAAMAQVTTQVSGLVVAETGLGQPDEPVTTVVDRGEWVERNLASFSHLLEPARRHLTERFGDGGMAGRSAAAMVEGFMQAETAAVLGFLARRVLGQYELVLPTGEPGDVIAYVGPNLLHLERLHQFRPSEFRFWVALHELTHRAQFQGIPWMRGYFLGLVAELVDKSRPEPGRLRRVLDELATRRRRGADLIDERGLFGLFATPGQHEVIDRVQALMCLLEGHGHVVMDRLGARHLRTQARMSRIMRSRRQDARTAAFFRLTGLEMKLRQYRLGERFVHTIEKEAGWPAIALAFDSPANLPSLPEIEDPGAWLRRVG